MRGEGDGPAGRGGTGPAGTLSRRGAAPAGWADTVTEKPSQDAARGDQGAGRQDKLAFDPGERQDARVSIRPERERGRHRAVCIRQLARGVEGGVGQQGGDPQTYLPGPIPARQRDPLGPRAPNREDRSDAPGAQGEPAGALFTG